MKKTVSIIMVVALLLSFCVFYSFSADESMSYVEYFEDGSYGLTTIIFDSIPSKGSATRTKKYEYFDSNNNRCWVASITASFTYNGTTANCTAVSKSTTIYNNTWRCTASSCSKSGATATGNFTFKHYVLGVPVKTINKTLTLTCDPNGNIT